MTLSTYQRANLPEYRVKFYTVGLWLALALVVLSGQLLYGQSNLRIDSLPANGLRLYSGWRWHSGDNSTWANPAFDDSRWDTIRPNRSITNLPAVQKNPQGWLRLTFILDSAAAQIPSFLLIAQTGASELYLDGILLLRLGTVGTNYQQQEGYIPSSDDSFVLPRLSAGRHVLAVRIAQHRPPWYMPKFMYFNHSFFRIALFPANKLATRLTDQIYVQAIGNYVLIGIFFILSVIHFMYYSYRRQRINLFFGLTMLLGTSCILVIESQGFITNAVINEWMFLFQGLLITAFMLSLLITYYIYLSQSFSWILGAVAILMLISRVVLVFIPPINLAIISIIATIALFADGIRISIAAIRSKRENAWLMLISILTLILVLIIGDGVSRWLSTDYPTYSYYATAATNMLFFLILPISFALILAREYTQTNRNLEERLTEVAQLSREKESILTQQNEILEQQVTERTAELTHSLTELRETQQQLIQREKMASLGELTAGIAHEIQNPLNFVNNFAEVSGELIQELKQEREQEKPDHELEAEILDDLAQNLEKINHHGKRASSIVRSMLDHSRTSTGQREPTDLNALADEYLRLSYHGLRAKDKQFNAQLVSEFDPAIGAINMVAQDIGRVLLNLFNNAFYAVQERQRLAPPDYQPTVTVTTKRVDGFAEIRVSDNGTGISDAVKEKIFQPFFTTKPTGEGTGLGLSLSYDIVTKGHNGSLTLESTVNQGTTFAVRLPIALTNITKNAPKVPKSNA